jgi:hypothetical protein
VINKKSSCLCHSHFNLNAQSEITVAEQQSALVTARATTCTTTLAATTDTEAAKAEAG